MQCTAIAVYSGKRCRAHCLQGEDKCIIHSDSERAKHDRSKINLMTKAQMVVELQRQLRKVSENEDIDPLEKSKEIRAIIIQIDNIISSETGAEPVSAIRDEEGVLSFEKRVKKSMEEEEK